MKTETAAFATNCPEFATGTFECKAKDFSGTYPAFSNNGDAFLTCTAWSGIQRRAYCR